MLDPVLDVVGALLLLTGAFLTLAAAIGLIRLPDVVTRMHAATKPQTLGLICAMIGVAIYIRDPSITGWVVLAIILQMMTAPIAAHMIGRTAYRTNQVHRDLLDIDELADDLSSAGFTLASAPKKPSSDDENDDPDDDGPDHDDDPDHDQPDDDHDQVGEPGTDRDDAQPAAGAEPTGVDHPRTEEQTDDADAGTTDGHRP
ncbi:monovalent cation/H(+) antiporter subunit G [Naumannella halotolerans]|uniref:Monovalent cation/proton antiporter MnhG/PhaG subunit n=1 Tax=Naumannella halotolerans TaxID=993414 RepID=A0A4R7JCF8_9ACTN|nr:monovalent cation/H(+) antiporter subunit G [Naumannella halotolerans]TDT34139.1 monovalent cation/proton antiporter MnhG/PhaG subunit [Naumannella halotolerans]